MRITNGQLKPHPGKVAPVYAGQTMDRCEVSANAAAPPDRSPQIFQALGAQEKLVCCLTDNLQMLAERLQPIIPPQPPSEDDSGKDAPPEVYLCQIADQLAANNRQLGRLNDAIAVLMQIIEV